MIRAKKYKPESPEWVLAQFFDCWQRRAWRQILSYVRASWIDRYEEMASGMIKAVLNSRLIDTRFVQLNADTGAVVEYLVEISYRAWSDYSLTDTVTTKIRLFRERKKWRVDPDSIHLV